MLSCHSFVEIDKERSHVYSDIAARFADSQSHTVNDNNCNSQRAGTPLQCNDVQKFHYSKDRGPTSQEPTRSGHSSGSPPDDNFATLTSFQAWTLPPIQNHIPDPASRTAFQQVQAAPSVVVRPSPPLRQLDQRSSHPIGVQNLLNPLKAEMQVNTGIASGTLSEKTTGSTGSMKSQVPALPFARSFPRHQLNQEPAHSQPQNCKREEALKPALPQLALPGDSPGTQYSPYGQISPIEPIMAPSPAFTCQPQSSFSNSFPSSGPSSIMLQEAFGTEGQYRMMTLETKNGPPQVSVDMQAASKFANEKRKRNATASHRFRQRRKEKERGTSQHISKLEQQIREIKEDREFYRGERDYFRNVATRAPSLARLPPRPLSPRQTRHISLGGPTGYSNTQSQDREGRLRTAAYAPPHDALVPSVRFKRRQKKAASPPST